MKQHLFSPIAALLAAVADLVGCRGTGRVRRIQTKFTRARSLCASTLLAMSISAGCGDDVDRPSNSLLSSPTSPSRPFSVSGTVIDREIGPLPGVGVWLDPGFRAQQFPGGAAAATTDARGFFMVDRLTQPTALYLKKQGWEDRLASAATETVINLTMARRLEIAAGESLSATIWGDHVLDYEEFLDRCHGPSICTLIRVTTLASGVLTSRLRWTGARNRLGLFAYTDDGYRRHDASIVPSSDGSLILEVSAEVFSGTYPVVVRFEQSNGGPPAPRDSQAFELTTTLR